MSLADISLIVDGIHTHDHLVIGCVDVGHVRLAAIGIEIHSSSCFVERHHKLNVAIVFVPEPWDDLDIDAVEVEAVSPTNVVSVPCHKRHSPVEHRTLLFLVDNLTGIRIDQIILELS